MQNRIEIIEGLIRMGHYPIRTGKYSISLAKKSIRTGQNPISLAKKVY